MKRTTPKAGRSSLAEHRPCERQTPAKNVRRRPQADLEDARRELADVSSARDAAVADADARDVALARADAERRAARAAANAAAAEVATLKDALLRPPDPIPEAPAPAPAAEAPRTGFAALLNAFVDDELGGIG